MRRLATYGLRDVCITFGCGSNADFRKWVECIANYLKHAADQLPI